jgi:hypothetical protein
MRVPSVATLVIASTLLAGMLGSVASAAPAPSTLTGETLGIGASPVGTVESVGNCTTTTPNIAAIHYGVTGPAAGPYAGTYVEGGSFTIDQTTGQILDWDATFTITSGTTTIQGEKHFVDGSSGTGTCLELTATGADTDKRGSVSGLAYTATMTTTLPSGRTRTFVDTGTTDVTLVDYQVVDPALGPSHEYFLETFDSDLKRPRPAPPAGGP